MRQDGTEKEPDPPRFGGPALLSSLIHTDGWRSFWLNGKVRNVLHIEDGLAVLLSGWVPVWAATSAGAVARFPVLPGIDSLTLFADSDAAGLKAAEACKDRWRAAGREVVIAQPGRLA